MGIYQKVDDFPGNECCLVVTTVWTTQTKWHESNLKMTNSFGTKKGGTNKSMDLKNFHTFVCVFFFGGGWWWWWWWWWWWTPTTQHSAGSTHCSGIKKNGINSLLQKFSDEFIAWLFFFFWNSSNLRYMRWSGWDFPLIFDKFVDFEPPIWKSMTLSSSSQSQGVNN